MRVKEYNNRLAHVCWSPCSTYPPYIACGSAAEKSDSSSKTNSTLELLELNLTNPSIELELSGSIITESRFSKIIWGEGESQNLLMGGCENSKIYLYDYQKILQNSSDAVVKTLENHSGSVLGLDLNPFQNNLLASGACLSEILIWDLNNSSEPMTPGAKIQPVDDIDCVAWNKQVQHILASTCSGKCVVWDLRKNESIIKISDNMSNMKAKLVGWHPDIATQMCLSSDDDSSPYLQIWDLRFATSPLRILEGHQRGILNFCWSSTDSNLLISSAKDNKIICWNPNNATMNGEILYELPTSGQWCFDVSWCESNPNLVCTSSFESQINVYSLMGGTFNVVHQTSSKIMDSFGVDTNTDTPASNLHQQTTQVISQLKVAPKWMKKTCGARFGFGGKLVQFGKDITDSQNQEQGELSKKVILSQVVTDPNLVEKAQYLQSVLATGNLIEFCNYKIEIADNEIDSSVWKYIMATFYKDKNERILQLLGIENANHIENSVFNEVEKKLERNLNENTESLKNLDVNKTDDSEFFNNLKGQTNEIDNNIRDPEIDLSFDNEIDESIGKCMILGDYKQVVDLCIKEGRWTDAVLISNCFDKDLLVKTQKLYFQNNQNKLSKLFENVINKDWSKLIRSCNLEHWKEVLATILTYTKQEESLELCDQLGLRIETTDTLKSNLLNACICYICSLNIENLARCLEKLSKGEFDNQDSSISLQNLVEKIMAIKYSKQNIHSEMNYNYSMQKINEKIIDYAKLLTEQGSFLNAYSYINDCKDSSIATIKDRIFNALDPSVIQQYKLGKPEYPFASSLRNNNNNNSVSSKQPLNKQPSFSHSPVTKNNSYPSTSSFGGSPFIPTHKISNNITDQYQTNSTTTLNDSPKIYQEPLHTKSSTLFTPSETPAPQTLQAQPSIQSYMHNRAPTGWNDPPPFIPVVKSMKTNSTNQQNETPQFFQPSMTVPTLSSNVQNYPMQNQSFNLNPLSGEQNITSKNPHQNFVYNNDAVNDTSNRIKNNEKSSQPIHTQSERSDLLPNTIEREIPTEYQNIQKTFDNLLHKCMELSTTAILKRKLDDVGKKLEILYGKLKESSLSGNVIEGLCAIIQYLQINDYASALNFHSQLVARSNFSEISGFMPGIKVLIQTCQQLNL